jgi:Txe/YoeB family toxin of Txe-Axe toxin-antitoxin module
VKIAVIFSLLKQNGNPSSRNFNTTAIAINPYIGKSLKGDLNGLYSYRLNRKDRLVYEIYEDDQTILIIRAKTHYGD